MPVRKLSPPAAKKREMDSEARRLRAQQAAEARWNKIRDADHLPEAEDDGVLKIGEVEVDVYLLKDKRRVISKKAIARVLGLKSEGGNAFLRTMTREGIRSGLSQKLIDKIENPIFFRPLTGDSADGYEAEVLIDVCSALINARITDRMHSSQYFLAIQAEIILRSTANIGIIALIDEAVGYVSKRKDEYRKLFDEFIRKEYRQWESEFPDKFFGMMYRLYGLKRQNPDSHRHPQFFGKFIRKYIYYPLAQSNGAILEVLDEKNPVVYAKGGRRYKLFQFLSDELGMPAFRQHLWQTLGIGEASLNREQFEIGFYRAFPEATPFGHQWGLDLTQQA